MSAGLQFIILVGFGALCFGCGYLTAFIVTRNKWRDEMIKRGIADALEDRASELRLRHVWLGLFYMSQHCPLV
jgi:hypothetical protein